MCGIFGIVIGRQTNFRHRDLNAAVDGLFVLSESRGKEAAGLAILTDEAILVHKRPGSASQMIHTPEYRAFFAQAMGTSDRRDSSQTRLADGRPQHLTFARSVPGAPGWPTYHKAEYPRQQASAAGGRRYTQTKNDPGGRGIERPVAVIGHSRLVTDGAQNVNDNNQPVLTSGVVGVHNGIIVNGERLWRERATLERRCEVDTEIVLALIHEYRAAGRSVVEAFQETFAQIEGTASVAVLFDDLDDLVIATNNGSLYALACPGTVLFASERHTLDAILQKRRFRNLLGRPEIEHVKAGEGRLVNAAEARVVRFSLLPPGELFEDVDEPRTSVRAASRTGRSEAPFEQLSVDGPEQPHSHARSRLDVYREPEPVAASSTTPPASRLRSPREAIGVRLQLCPAVRDKGRLTPRGKREPAPRGKPGSATPAVLGSEPVSSCHGLTATTRSAEYDANTTSATDPVGVGSCVPPGHRSILNVQPEQQGALHARPSRRSILEILPKQQGPLDVRPKNSRTGSDLDDNNEQPPCPPRTSGNGSFHVPASLEAAFSKNEAAVARLRRCTRCILPETMPFIEFDDQGVCNYCRSHRRIVPQGRDALEAAVAPFRRHDGEPDCLAAFSGGRDSSFGVHYLKRELGLHPVAFTYDWGMVTDLARRNISRICAKLGVEHILVSADIPTKRRYIRQNVLAWLRQPDLGLIPLFMAGDKQYFYHARQVRRRLGLPLLIMCENPLERTDFKSGFCGTAPHVADPDHVQALSIANQARLVWHYGRNYLANRAYWNRSLPDTLFAYACFYAIKRDYLNLYRYIDWDEHRIVATLLDAYNWELANDTHTTWRIGDGTAPFYNYIYYTVAGFTENDTFRSNQIRHGLISRPQALEYAARDNRPRWQTIHWYLRTIGLDADFAEILARIHAIPKRYST